MLPVAEGGGQGTEMGCGTLTACSMQLGVAFSIGQVRVKAKKKLKLRENWNEICQLKWSSKGWGGGVDYEEEN